MGKNKSEKNESNLDWIFQHPDDVLSAPVGPSIEKLARCLGIKTLWTKTGEGMAYLGNSLQIRMFAEPFLRMGNKDRWLEFCGLVKEGNRAAIDIYDEVRAKFPPTEFPFK